MKIWILNTGEALPIDPGANRLLRCGYICNLLLEQGHEVTWWSSTFRHLDKTHRFGASTRVTPQSRLKIWCLRTPAYRKNKSVRRIVANRFIAREFERVSLSEDLPDLIFASYPVPELALAAARYARRHDIPAVVDVRDLWPDVWSEVFPSRVRPIADLALLPFYWHSRCTLSSFGNIFGITDQVVDWAVKRAGRNRTNGDVAFPHAYPAPDYTPIQRAQAVETAARLLAVRPFAIVTLAFFGNLASRTRVEVCIAALRRLPPEILNSVRIVICGSGEMLEDLQLSAADLPQVIFTGRVSGPELEAIADKSDAGLLPYPSGLDFRRSIPNKAIEYMAYGLPIITSLSGPVSELINHDRCGFLYRETDPQDLALLIAKLVENPSLLKACSIQVKRVFRERFRASSVYGRMVHELMTIANHPSAKGLG